MTFLYANIKVSFQTQTICPLSYNYHYSAASKDVGTWEPGDKNSYLAPFAEGRTLQCVALFQKTEWTN